MSANHVLYVRQQALNAGEKSLNQLYGHREESVVNTLDQVRAAGWSITGANDRITAEYDEPGGPFQNLVINRANSVVRAARQDKTFRNCYQDDNVCAPISWLHFHYCPPDLIIGCYQRNNPKYLQCPWPSHHCRYKFRLPL